MLLQYIEYGAKSQDPPTLPPATSIVVSNAVGTTAVASSAAAAVVSTVAVSGPSSQPTHGAISRPATSAAVSTRVSTDVLVLPYRAGSHVVSHNAEAT